ncbi:MAG TPA: membrane protein insertion efficiency factor YidD [Rhodospirillales bacterium]|nr:membrane protein insertion efficiency factor YidD [Rhodospirillales bacterium]
MSPAARLLSVPVYAWRWLLSPVLPLACRYAPSCSAYAIEALRRHGALAGGLLALRRLSRCHPWGGAGFDPVPPPSSHPNPSPSAAGAKLRLPRFRSPSR